MKICHNNLVSYLLRSGVDSGGSLPAVLKAF